MRKILSASAAALLVTVIFAGWAFAGYGPANGTGNGPGDSFVYGSLFIAHNGNGPGDGTGNGAPDGAGTCPGE